jgi:anti-anti-sigma factor
MLGPMEALRAAKTVFLRATVLHFEGGFDLSDRVRIQDAFAVAAASPLVVIDFEKTSSIDSSVLQCLAALWQVLNERNSRLRLVGVRQQIAELLRICRFEHLFEIRPTLNDAIGKECDVGRLGRLTVVGTASSGVCRDGPYRASALSQGRGGAPDGSPNPYLVAG